MPSPHPPLAPTPEGEGVIALVDSSPYLYRAFHAVPRTVTTRDGQPANVTHGFASFLIRLLQEERPSHLAALFDFDLGRSFRSALDPRYKATREAPPLDLLRQIPDCMELAAAMGLTVIVEEGFEADDLVASLVARHSGTRPIVVVSGDKDLTALVADGVLFYDFAKGERLDLAGVRAKLGVDPAQVADLLGLAGDAVDGIPGVAGVGRKTAVALLERFGTLERLYAEIESVPDLPLRGARALRDRLLASRSDAFLSKRLATLATDAPVPVSLDAIRIRGRDPERTSALFDRLGLGTLRARIEMLT